MALVLVASLLPQGIAGQTPDPSAAPSTAPTPSEAPAANVPTETTAPDPEPAGDQPAGVTRFPFRWLGLATGRTVNPLTAGGIKNIRFSLGGNRGLGVIADGWPRSQRFDCRTGALAPRNSQFKTRPFGAAGLRYGNGVYTYAWQTREDWSRQCRVFQLRLTDGTTHTVRFRMLPFRFILPTKRQPATNQAEAGDLVRIRFRMSAGDGKAIFYDTSQPRSARVDCDTGAIRSAWARTDPRGRAGLSRSGTEYRYRWQTSASWAGTCRRFEMRLKDGTIEHLTFRFSAASTNDAPVVPAASRSVSEDAPNGTNVGAPIPFSDPDAGDSHTFAIIAGNVGSSFAIDATTGQLTVADSTQLDQATRPTYSLTVRVTDDGTPSRSGTGIVTVTVTDPNDPPVISGGPFSIAEDATDGATVGTMGVSDPDAGQSHAFEITAGNTGGAFAIDADSGEITVADQGELDHETRPSYTLTIRVTDDGTPPLDDDTEVTIDVADVNEPPDTPVDSDGAANSVAEGAANGTSVGLTASAADPEGSGVTYSISADTSGGGFAIDPSSGVVTVADGTLIDYESSGTGHSYDVTIEAADGSDTSSATFTIAVTNTDPTSPTDSDGGANSVAEGAPNGTSVGITASSVDVNGPAVSYSLTDDAGGRFAIGATSGEVTVADGTLLDVDAATSHDITVQASDGAGGTSAQTFTVAVTNADPGIPTDADSGANTVAEGAAQGTAVGITAHATDPGGGSVSYALTDDAGGRFVIDPTTGVVSVSATGATTIDYESSDPAHSYDITVQASDGGTGASIAAFTIDVTNVAPGQPVDSDPTTNQLKAGTANGTTVGVTASATDVNGGTVSYAITADTSGGGFAIDPTTGVVTIADTSLLAGGDEVITVAASDGVLEGATADFTITVVPNAPPVAVATTATTPEDTPIIITLTGTDANDDPLTFTIPAVTTGSGTLGSQGLVDCSAVNTCTTTITYTPVADANGPDSFTFTVNDGVISSTAATVSITITPVNDPPVDADEAFAVQSNVGIQIAAPGLLAGATDIDGDAVVMLDGGPGDSVGTFATTQGGSITIAADGSFTYTPQAGDASLADTFGYTVSDGNGGTNTSTVTFNVNGDTIWFVRLDAATNGIGTVSSPFNTLASLDDGGPDADGSTIFVYTAAGSGGTATLADDLDLQVNQHLVGQGATRAAGATINTYRGFTTQPNSLVLPPINGAANPSISASANVDAITLATGNTLEGFDIGGRAAGVAPAAAIAGTSFGTLSISDVGIAGTGQTLRLTTGTIQAVGGGTATFTTLSSTGTSGTGLSLDGVAGTISAGGAISGAVSATVSVNAGTVSLAYSGNLSQANNAPLVSVTGGHTTGTLTFSGTLSATNGTGLQFNNADSTTSYAFTGITSLNGGDAGIDITGGSAGSFSFGGTTITNPSGVALNVDGATGPVSISGAISKTSAGRLIDFNAFGSATATISGGLTCTVACTGIEVTNGSGPVIFSGPTKTMSTGTNTAVNLVNAGTVNFTGGNLDITTTSGGGFSATGGGTVTVQGTSNDITSATGTALNVQNTTIGGAGLTFQSISSNGAASGISLSTTGAGALTVTGNSAGLCGGQVANGGATVTAPVAGDCSGGAILASTGPGISLSSTGPVSLTRMRIANGGSDGISGSGAGGLALTSSLIENNGNAVGERGIDIINLTGTGGMASSTVRGSAEHNVFINNTSGTLSSFNVTNSQFATPSFVTGDDGIQLLTDFAGSITASITQSAFTDNKGDHFQAATTASATGTINVTFSNNTLLTTPSHDDGLGTDDVIGGGITISPSGAADVLFTIDSNNIQQAFDDAINLNLGTASAAAGSMVGTISNNTIGTASDPDSGSESSNTITVTSNGAGTTTVAVTNNVIRQYGNGYGILLDNKEGNSSLNATVTGNNVDNPGTFAINGIHVNAGATAGPPVDSGVTCAAITGNAAINAGLATADIRLRQRFNTTIRLPGYAGAANDSTAVNAFVSGNNGGAEVTSINNVGGGGFGFVGGAACTLP